MPVPEALPWVSHWQASKHSRLWNGTSGLATPFVRIKSGDTHLSKTGHCGKEMFESSTGTLCLKESPSWPGGHLVNHFPWADATKLSATLEICFRQPLT